MLKRTEVSFNPFRDGELQASAPTTEAQKELWTSIAAEPEANLCYNECVKITLKGELDGTVLEGAVNEAVKRHDALRSTFSPDGKQILVKTYTPIGVIYRDLTSLSNEALNAELERHINAQTKTQFDLENGPLFKAELIKIGHGEHMLLLSAHHMVCDGWSLSVLVGEISEYYELIKKSAKLPQESSAQFFRLAGAEKECPKSLLYWKNEFKDLPKPLNLPVDFERPRFRSFNSKRIDYQIDPDLYRETRGIAAKNRKSVYQYLLSAFTTCIHLLSNDDDIVVGISLAGQAKGGLDSMVGHMVRFLPIRSRLNGTMTFRELLNQTREKMLDASEHQEATFGQILKNLQMPRDPSRVPLIDVVFNVDQQYPGQGFKFKDIEASYVSIPRVCDNFEIKLNATTKGDECILECQYNDNLYRASTIQTFLKMFEDCLSHFNKNLDAQIGSFQLVQTPTEVLAPKTEVAKQAELQNTSDGNLGLTREIWESVMGMKGIPNDSNFFSIGGHSLLAVDICHKVLEKTGKKLTLKDLVLHPTIASFSTLLPAEKSEGRNEFSTKGLAAGLKEAQLTLSQFQAWYQEQIHTGTTMHNLPSSFRVKTNIDMAKLETAYIKLIENYPALRTSVLSGPVQVVGEAHTAMQNLGLELIEGLSLDEVVKQMQELTLKPYDLTKAPLFRSKVYKLAENDFVVFNCFHHMIFDGWSFDIFFQALSDAYEGRDLQPEGASFLDYAKWQKSYLEGEEFKKDLSYWKNKLKNPLPVLEMPTDFPRPATISPESAAFPFEIESELALKVRTFCEKSGVSPFNVFLGCFKRALMDYSQDSEVVVGIPVRGRNCSDQLNTIGYFVNAVAIRTEKRDTVMDFLNLTQDEVAQALEHQNAPFEKVRENLEIKRDTSRPPVVQTFFSFQEIGNRKNQFNGAPYKQINLHKAAIHTDLDIWIKAGREKVEGAIEYRKELFKHESIDRFQKYFRDLIAFVVSEQGDFWEDFKSPSLSKELAQINDTLNIREDKRVIVDFVDEMATKNPNQVAVVAGDTEMTYAELASLSAKMAGFLRSQGVKKGDLVGISQDRDERLMVSVLGVMKAGAGYVPLDPYFPPDRLDYMVEQSGLKIILTHEHYTQLFEHHPVSVCPTEDINLQMQNEEFVHVEDSQTAYVIYTSGSTGRPKGVNISYQSAMNFLHSVRKEPGFSSENKILAVTTFCFDISVLELFLPLVAGGTVYIATKAETIDGEALKRTIETKGIDVLQATPPTWRILLAAGWRGGDNFKVLCGGEAFPRDLAESLIPICGSVWNMYGPTEATVWATCKKLESHKGTILIGRPLENYSVYVLDEKRRPVPFGAIGELYIGGEGLALGYYKRDDLTEERFVDDLIRGSGKMYKTGDLARFHSNGELECLGRNDDQVKIRGYRIELGEVEASLAEIEEISQAVAMAREDRPGDVRLVGYFISKDGSELDQFALREKLGKRLPPYMIPANFIQLDEFPLTLTGKVERKKLPAIDFEKVENDGVAYRRGNRDAPIDEVERKLARIWTGVIGVEDYDLDDSFFDVGGNSLLSVEVFAKISKDIGVDLPLATLVSHSKFGELLDVIRDSLGVVVEEEQPSSFVDPAQIFGTKVEPKKKKTTYDVPAICSTVVPIKPAGSKTPVFCFHGVGGNVLNYIKIAPHFGEHPLFGIQSQGVDGKAEPLHTIDEMAQKYMDEIRLVQPFGPYILAGGSMGGMLAFETARKLQEAGEKVESLIMLDTYGPSSNFKGFMSKGDMISSYWFSFKWNLRKRIVRLQTKLLTALGFPIPHGIRHFNIEVLNYQALWSHSPRIYNGDIELIRAPIEKNGWYGVEDMGWGTVVTGRVNVRIVKGDHSNFVEAPMLPEALKDVLTGL